MKYITKLILCITIGLLFLGCKMEIETSIKNLNTFFNKDKITLIEEKRGGIGGVFKKKLEFIHIKDSVKVVISDVELISNFKRTLKISLTDFEEIKIGIICIATNHIENEIPDPAP